jgi:hypothetical protein
MRNVKWSIWPVKPLRGTVHVGVAIDEWLDGLARSRESLKRARCIGEGHVRARARMERFVAWLREQDACEEGIAFARQHVSPEAAVHAAAAGAPEERRHACWLWMVVPRYGGSCPGCDRDASELLASKEWASLPWQRDPEVR